MNLLQNIKSDRTEKNKKQPYKSSVFNRIGGIVRVYGLEDAFLKVLDVVKDHTFDEDIKFNSTRPKRPIELPLFSLLTGEEYRVTEKIIDRVNNPFLGFVNSPEEILLCKALFLRNPAIAPDTLANRHFETLLLCELAKEKVKDLAHRMSEINGKNETLSPDEQVQANSLRDRIKHLRTFVKNIEERSS